MASFICTKLNLLETEDLAAAKGFLQRRRDMIWDDQLWKDSLFEYTQSLTGDNYLVTSTWLPTKRVLLLPTQITHPIAVRTDTRKLNVESSEIFYRQDFDIFASSGQATQYRLLPPVVWELDSTKLVDINGGDDDADQTADYLAADGVTVTRETAQVGAATQITTGRIDSVKKDVTSSELTFKDAATATVFLSLGAEDLAALKRQRIHILGSLPDPTVIRVLGKVKPPTFTADTDEPGLTGVENCLLAFAQADMLQRERQYGKAQAVTQEAVALLDQLKKVQVTQQAHHQRLIPEGGYGWEYQNNNSPLTF